ncbi:MULTISPECIES: cyanophycin synthetase [unclassified Undibacterium]|uniref:cyanophycin synthetase n=1 Tax=unclassified Undibacterium TaxID=2630295 RepID=UPI002AC94BBD|nr:MULTISPECIES: cyanophycin synthetase [unclassified Undibacterium]MEB0141005.1 cyanophycin synthetase [Undibacterium sp. CCC2.1]MEB0171946.1 cyanophycin synthetase [Undibacterium sp. CCC1.1]MEB0177948.1 cyanophycin synthetase [Undibacterium sp. CCC3.4]MEB0217184.1 cyanophycin synthetase [Undibacterium sp. 5I2]WPX43559.1 cyanophycin synthetase [Undibacterium sp. CCC3.4]
MEVSRIRALRGPNLWSHHTAVEAIVTCSTNEAAITDLPGFEDRLRALFPELSILQPTGHHDAIPIAHVFELTALGLQAQAGCPVTFSRTTQTLEPGIFQVVVEYSEEAVGRLAVELAEQLIAAALNNHAFDLAAALEQLRELDEDVRLGPSTGAIVDAALARNIPYRRLTDGSLVVFGWGSRQRKIQAAEMDGTSAIAEAIAQDKELTKKLLHAAGVPVPLGRIVNSAADAWAAALEIGVPVVVKPKDGNQGKGVTVNVTTREQLEAGYHAACEFRDDVLVERFLPGNDFRLLVIGNKLIAAARRDPPQVVGNGKQSVRQLVEQVNKDPRRGSGHSTSMTKIRFDDIALASLEKQGFHAESVPPKGQRVILRNNANLSTGGGATDVTDDVHPEVAARAIAAAQMIGLDICGVDLVCDSVLKPIELQNGGIVEVNAAPGLRMHLSPSFGKGRAVGEAIVNAMFEESEDGRIPIVAVTGTNGKTTTVRLIAHLLSASGLRTGMTNTDGVYVAGHQIDSGDCSGPRSARNVLSHPDVDAAVFETARGGVLREGLAYDRCQVAVVTNIGSGDHLGLNYITTVEDLAVLKRVIVQNVADNGYAVLNAADPIVVSMAANCPSPVIFFAADPYHPVMTTHRAQGKRTVYIDRSELVAVEGKTRHSIALAEIPITRHGSIGFQVENVMASVAAAWAVGISWDAIRAGLKSFANEADNAPGRFNVFNYRGATVIADYGHNPDAILALVKAVETMPAKRRSVVISGAGDRRDQDIRQQTEILGEAFDDVVLYQDQCQRGRADGEVVALLREGLKTASKTTRIDEITGEFIAIDLALERLGEGDLCLILIDQVEAALEHIAARVAAG